MATFLAWIVRALHIALLLFVIFGWSAQSAFLLSIHAAFIPAMVLHWKTNNDRCFLTVLEDRLVGGKPGVPGGFIGSLIEGILGSRPSDAQLKVLLYFVLITTWSLSCVKIASNG